MPFYSYLSLIIQDVGMEVSWYRSGLCDWIWLKYMAQNSAEDGFITNSDHYNTDYIREIYSNTNDCKKSHSFFISLLAAALYTMRF